MVAAARLARVARVLVVAPERLDEADGLEVAVVDGRAREVLELDLVLEGQEVPDAVYEAAGNPDNVRELRKAE